MFAEITPIPTNKLSVGNVAKLPAEEEAKNQLAVALYYKINGRNNSSKSISKYNKTDETENI